jgi:hypothetical protein
MISPLFEKAVIIIGGLLCLAGLYYLYSHFPLQATIYVIASIVGTIGVGALVFIFTRNPA